MTRFLYSTVLLTSLQQLKPRSGTRKKLKVNQTWGSTYRCEIQSLLPHRAVCSTRSVSSPASRETCADCMSRSFVCLRNTVFISPLTLYFTCAIHAGSEEARGPVDSAPGLYIVLVLRSCAFSCKDARTNLLVRVRAYTNIQEISNSFPSCFLLPVLYLAHNKLIVFCLWDEPLLFLFKILLLLIKH